MAAITYLQGAGGITARIRVSMGVGEDGRQLVKSMSYHPPRGLGGEEIRLAATAAAERFERRLKEGSDVLREGQSLEDFWVFYAVNRRGHLTEPSLFAYTRVMEGHVLPALGDRALCDIAPRDIRLFIDKLTVQEKLAPRTVHKIYSVLRSVLALACELDILERTPCDKNKIKLPGLGQPKIQFYSADEAAVMLMYLQNEELMFRALVSMALLTGMRRGEILALWWEDLDLESGEIAVSKSQYKLTGQQVCTKGTKTAGSVRRLVMPAQVKGLMVSLKAQSGGRGLIFTGRGGKPISPDCFSSKWRQFLQKCGLPHKKLHSLRHSAATLLLAQGLSVADVSAQLGHSSIRTTAIYTHAMSDSADRAAKAMEKVFG